ncbi:GntR family transcriptional regulator [Nonomuraea aridisoli]|uniref:GntR family transcriptional regulator n=1 Tax=Nonomuraea aridisoli TaxID=2070368 RepID=A0A2W2EWN0_9ACTN|nr:GntR family transcriptional regulator [Nonomuraea aridisoli]PZG17960.1 GntR family transcriptional regulator [Nonomuraea aridisoli]
MSVLDRDGPIPLYVQVADVIQERIAGGQLRTGERVPSEAALEAEFGIARTTARNVARELRRRRLVHTVRGEGTFVGPAGVPRVKPTRALHARIAEDLVARIRRGELRPDRPFPSDTTLMRQYGVARVTARRAVSRLRERRWVVTVPQRGTYVCGPGEWPEEPSR